MNNSRWNFDVKSLIIGFLLAIVAVFVFNGTSSRAAGGYSITADENGVYIMNDNGTVKYTDKQKCRTNFGCIWGS